MAPLQQCWEMFRRMPVDSIVTSPLDPDMGKMYHSTVTKPYECDLPPLPSSSAP